MKMLCLDGLPAYNYIYGLLIYCKYKSNWMHKSDSGKSKKKRVMTSEKEREMEKETLDHFIHEHPLSLMETGWGYECRGCNRRLKEEAAYGCKKCGERMLHQDCAEMAREIRHPLHPQHTLVQKTSYISFYYCALCKNTIYGIGYFCISLHKEFQIHLRCAYAEGVECIVDVQTSMMHPSHPKHPLILVSRRHSFKCDACGAMETGKSYVCITCQYWIHERCTNLPPTADFHHLHHHPLSLAFYLPQEYIKYDYVCDVCRKDLQLNRWVYHCKLCRFVAHIKCATRPPLLLPPTTSSVDKNETNAQGLIQFPIYDVYEELIKPFVVKERGGGEETMIILEDHKYWFPNHHHQLIMSLVVSSIDNDDEDEDEEEDESKSTIICDGCTAPISQKHTCMMRCCSASECKYFLHLACFFLPPELPCHPLHEADHNLLLHKPDFSFSKKKPKMLDFSTRCNLCRFDTNGLMYTCTKCDFKADIKCASLSNTIQHRAHPNHYLHSKFLFDPKEPMKGRPCRGCGYGVSSKLLYKCGSCEFLVCVKCAFLPPTNKHESDKHPLPLTYDANLNHPDGFICDACETEMNPKEWMYHCRDCDTSFHPRCFPATSGDYRNFKFGQRYAVPAALHPHPLTFSLLTTKLRCDVCGSRIYGSHVSDQRGFHCSSCNFFICLDYCYWRLTHIQPLK